MRDVCARVEEREGQKCIGYPTTGRGEWMAEALLATSIGAGERREGGENRPREWMSVCGEETLSSRERRESANEAGRN